MTGPRQCRSLASSFASLPWIEFVLVVPRSGMAPNVRSRLGEPACSLNLFAFGLGSRLGLSASLARDGRRKTPLRDLLVVRRSPPGPRSVSQPLGLLKREQGRPSGLGTLLWAVDRRRCLFSGLGLSPSLPLPLRLCREHRAKTKNSSPRSPRRSSALLPVVGLLWDSGLFKRERGDPPDWGRYPARLSPLYYI
ncbi:uncharacterized protein C8Q71DRAFT_557089 [Rhodofomes roseus]|uniref:Uncharacterized protein n=1 Tax=Rhodofomes roseus TaxID=34475 RepID=A0ABQ8KI75_9APHY|nr:uncharacterized protein C8Q71DRAFT_557089 [Rhodofomes roseus]KAH9837704.1 hypothetical protein C8Q71DRAFT_557089 [Rhodofomes roseus]